MKKTILFIMLILLVAFAVYAVKPVDLTEIVRLKMVAQFNYDEDGNYYPFRAVFSGSVSGEGVTGNRKAICLMGTPKSGSPYTPKELYQWLKLNMGQEMADALKDLYLEIDEDITQP